MDGYVDFRFRLYLPLRKKQRLLPAFWSFHSEQKSSSNEGSSKNPHLGSKISAWGLWTL